MELKKAEEILNNLSNYGIEGAVKKDLEDFKTTEEKITYLKDVLNLGGKNGGIPKLTYYYQTNAFYDEFCDEIENHLLDYMVAFGYINRFDALNRLDISVISLSDEKSVLSWFAYELIAKNILSKIEEA